MRILIYSGLMRIVAKSGIGQAMRQQQETLALMNMPSTMDARESYDAVHLNTIFPDSLLICWRAKRQGKKVVYYAHSTMEDFRNSFRGSNVVAPLFKRWITYCYNSGDIIITPTGYSKKLLEGYNLKRPVYSLSNGIDTEFFRPEESARQRFRSKYGLQPGDKAVISVGHYIQRKGITDFVTLAGLLPEYQFYWFGYTNPNLIPREVKQAISRKLPNLHFPGYVDRQELRDAYSGSDLFLFLSHEETEGIVLLEALASQVPVLLRDIPIYAEWLKEGETVYKGRTISEFREKIAAMLERRLPDLTERGYQEVLDNDLKEVGRRLLAIYEKELN
ncbi:glycosyltransferase [Paenibacillus sp. MMS20-IR301]|uniref:glycosyltransferase n=1 Tax=Paenibacillus sp. MMS20-IR301 TaxID=2895946 RepID=UPI0028E59A05|nr:glycosyltransferase [Paenibacillus sp. MMS20-IR301]WNS43470.1 glycosyltransferase [Paenibacillus sp. MMS20-IR301]